MHADSTHKNRPDNQGPRALALLLSLGAAAALVLSCATTARAQGGDSVSKTATAAGGQGSPSSTQTTRSRRVEEGPGEAAAASDPSESPDDPPLSIGEGGDRLGTLRAQIEGAKTEAERARLRRTLVDYLVALGKKSEAIGELRAMSREERVDPVGFYNIGNALARLGDTDTAIDAYRKAIKQRHGNYARALNNLGVMYLRQGRWEEAQESFVSALRLENFRYGEASYNLGRVYGAQGEADLAIREWARALAAQPDHADAAIALARAYAEDGSPARGVAVLDAFVERRGPSPQMAEARREIMSAGSGAPAAPAVTKTAAANSRADKGQGRDKAVEGRRAAERLRPLTVDTETYDLLQRARAAREGGRYEDAASLYRRVITRADGFFPPANLELGFVLNSMKRHEEATAALAEVAKRDGARYPIAYYHLGRQYEVQGRLGDAAKAYEKAVAAFAEENPQFLLDLSRVREKGGDVRGALEALESYVAIRQRLGGVPEWSNERLTELRQKVAESSVQPPAPRQ